MDYDCDPYSDDDLNIRARQPDIFERVGALLSGCQDCLFIVLFGTGLVLAVVVSRLHVKGK